MTMVKPLSGKVGATRFEGYEAQPSLTIFHGDMKQE
jgi:hypothetical protein